MSAQTYREKLLDPRWQKKRLEIFNRDGFACRDCGEKSKTLHVHHCSYSKGGPWNTEDALLLTLCEDCHPKRQELEDEGKKAISRLFARMGHRHDDEQLRAFVSQLAHAVDDPEFIPRLVDDEEFITTHELAVYGQRAFSATIP